MKDFKDLPVSYQKDIKKVIQILKENGATEIYIFGSKYTEMYLLCIISAKFFI